MKYVGFVYPGIGIMVLGRYRPNGCLHGHGSLSTNCCRGDPRRTGQTLLFELGQPALEERTGLFSDIFSGDM